MRFARTESLAYSLIVAIVASIVVALTFAASAAYAQLTSPPPAGTHHLYSVLGVINTGTRATYFECTSTSASPQNVTVEAFDETGAASGSGSLAVAAGKTVRFGTQDANGFTVDSILASGVINAGAARILSTDRKLLCHAQISNPSSAIPELIPVTIVAKLKQKAAN